MWAVPDTDKMRLLLDAGADVNARSGDRRTALVVASGIVGAAPALRLLLDYGADPWVWRATDPSPLREAVRADEAEMFQVAVGIRRQPEGCRCGIDDVRSHELFQVCRNDWCRWTTARTAAGARSEHNGSAVRPRSSQPADTSGSHAGDADCHPRGGRSQPATAPGRRRGLHQADRLRLLSPQQHRLAGGCGGSRPRPMR